MAYDIEVRLGPRRPKVPEDQLGFGKVFTDHMFMADWDAKAGWHHLRVAPHAPISLDPAANVFHYGQAIFEGQKAYRWADGSIRVFRPERNCQRMAVSAARLCMAPIDPEMLLRGILAVVDVDRDWVPSSPGTALYIRPVLIGTGSFLGVRPADRYLLYVLLSPVGAYYAQPLSPVKIWIEQDRVRAAPGGIGAAKTGGNYAASLLSGEEARKRGYDQVLWVDACKRQALQEVGMMNLMLRIGDEIITPPLDGSILAGVTRESILTLLHDWGMKVSEREITIDEVAQAARNKQLLDVFGIGTGAVVSPVSELAWKEGRLELSAPGELARRIYDALTGIQYGKQPDTHGWMKKV